MAITSLLGNNIADIGNLVFFTEKGYEVPTEKTYTIQWEIIPCSQASDHFITNPTGHFMFDISESNKHIYTIIDNNGKLTNTPLTLKSSPNKDNNIKQKAFNAQNKALATSVIINGDKTENEFIYDKTVSHVRNMFTGKYEECTQKISERIGNTVKITFNTLNETIVRDYPIEYVFSDVKTETVTSKNIDNDKSFSYIKITDLTLTPITNDNNQESTLINILIENNFSYETLFPCVRYMGNVKQDKVSTEFIGASTFIILEETDINIFERPNFGDSCPYNLYFEFQKDSEMKFISTSSIAEIIWQNNYTATLGRNDEVHDFNEILDHTNHKSPIYFTVGFESELEGCYQNIMAMFLKQKNSDKKYLVGLFTFLTEVEGEDERYRALLGNLGIPDPIKYPNIFKEQDPQEQGVDWTLINTKSKELMVSYDNIFPYVGTYKALLGAVKFLGYQDLIFKEWYKIKDSYNRDKYVTLQTYDLVEGKSLKSKLKRIGVEFGEFERYKKLNRLSMIYHLNEIDDETGEYIDFYTKRTDVGNKATTTPEGGLYKAAYTDYTDTHPAVVGDNFTSKTNQYMQLPITYKIYEYRTDEILAKLFSVKRWLEKYILGVNCYISDICGEFIVVERFKNQSYVTQHHLKDIGLSGCFTPKIVKTTPFEQSESVVTCSLNEFDSITFENYEDFLIESFIREEWKPAGSGTPIYISAPLETLVVANEYQFKLTNNNSSSGTLAEFTHADYLTNPMLIQDNEIKFFDDSQNITKIDPSELPIIEIAQGNLRLCHGNWKSNVAFSINTVVDQKTGNEFYSIYDEINDDVFYKGTQKVFLYPYVKNEAIDTYKLYWYYGIESNKVQTEFEGRDSEMVYTTHTKWNVPMLIIRNYKCGNNNEMMEGDYILEIVKGRLLFRNHKSEINHGKAEGCEVVFGQEFESKEQPVDINYLYISEREPIYTFDKTGITKDSSEDDIAKNVSTNRYIDIPVNRIGAYTVQVEAFDMYNNIFVNKSDDITNINTRPIEIDTILNQDYMSNEPDFCDKNGYGEKLSEDEISTLLYNDITRYAAVPLYPQTYRIYDIDPVLDDPRTIEYDNISYAIDTPKIGDFLVFNNFTERVLNLSKNGDEYILKLVDENPNIDTIKNAEYVGLCIYDSLQKKILNDIYPLEVTDNTHIRVDSSIMLYDVNNSYIKIKKTETTYEDENTDLTLDALSDKCQETCVLDSSSYFINSINAYLYSANELILDTDDISVNMDKKETYITDDKQHFVDTQVVKICFTNDTSIHNNYTKNSIDNETAYRIKRVQDNGNSFTYILDGIIDLQKLNNKLYHNNSEVSLNNAGIAVAETTNPYMVKMCSAHLRAAQYILRVDGFGEELTYNYNRGTVMRTRVEYCPTPLFFNDYLDTTYSAQIYDYDPKMLQNIWCDPLLQFSSNDTLYCFKNFPVTVNKGRIVIMRPDENQSTLSRFFNDTEVGLKINWEWKSYIIDDQSNWHSNLNLIDKQIIFKSVNKILCVKPELLGSQTVQMTCCDIYGNRLINGGEGFVYVNDNTYIVNNKEQDTRELYYKDVFIVGFETQFTHPYIAPATANSNEYSLDLPGVSSAARADKSPVTYNYKIYYSDGTIMENEGANVVLLTPTGKESKSNKVKLKFGNAKYPHKYVAGYLRTKMKLERTNERDLVSPEQIFEVPVYQYGYSVTTSIYNLSFDVKPIPKEGIEELNRSTIGYYITNIHYTLTRSEGEVEEVSADNLYDAHLQITSVKFIHNQYGVIEYIPENKGDTTNIGILQMTVRFYINGVQDMIMTRAISNVTQL